MNTRTVSLLFGVIFIAVGILGFTPNGLVAYDGIFAVNAVHNLVHILTGLIFLIAVIKYPGYAGRVLKIVGVAYVAVTIIGFLTSGNMMNPAITLTVQSLSSHPLQVGEGVGKKQQGV